MTVPRLFAAAVACTALACNIDREAIYQQVYTCDLKAADPGCGTDRDGQAMTCFAGRTLGGSDFCASRCGPASIASDMVCAQSGAKLATCDLSAGGNPDCGQAGLGCFRHNLLSDSGVCVTITPCASDGDCHDPVRASCATSIVKRIYDHPESFKNDHAWCLQAGCQANRTACSPGETCLRDVIPAAANPPDICVPNCDSNLRCPPAHFCYRKTSGPAAPPICVPGLLGFRCESPVDCLMGDCADIGAGYGVTVCSVKCGNDADCAKYDGQQGRFLCNDAHQCVTPSALLGSPCREQSDCVQGLACAFINPDSAQGNCLVPCNGDGTCPARAGVQHTCLGRGNGSPGICYPGQFGFPCDGDANCMGGMTCRTVVPGAPKRCTTLCAGDEDCGRNRWTRGGYCAPVKDANAAVCIPPLAAGAPCTRDGQCLSGRCSARGDGTMACAPTGER